MESAEDEFSKSRREEQTPNAEWGLFLKIVAEEGKLFLQELQNHDLVTNSEHSKTYSLFEKDAKCVCSFLMQIMSWNLLLHKDQGNEQ
eukprot:1380075-Pyramimonas_sp.AAC.1